LADAIGLLAPLQKAFLLHVSITSLFVGYAARKHSIEFSL